MASIIRWSVRGALSGLAGTVAEIGLTSAEGRLLGEAPYDSGAMATRLARRYGGIDLSRRQSRAAGIAMTTSYGTSWGIIGRSVASRLPWPASAAVLGVALLTFEVLALPATHATPSIGSWPRPFVLAEVVNISIYSLVTAYLSGDRHREAEPGPPPRTSDRRAG